MANYRIVKRLGKGGNGIVWMVTDGTTHFAKKVIKNHKNKRAYKRFKDEVGVIKKTTHPGIIELLYDYLPDSENIRDTPYYIMPLCIPLKDYINKGVSFDKTFDIVTKIIDSLSFLHSKEITHRDIKIENLLMLDDQPKMSDFGLANFPKQKRISRYNEKIGPAFTIDPAMRRNSSTADYKKADVYSLAKTLWVILTKKWKSFDGQYNPSSSIGLKNYIDLKINEMRYAGESGYYSIVILERLLIDATHNDPDKRPDIENFKARFHFWMRSNTNYYERNGLEWEDAIRSIFPISFPNSCTWNNVFEITEVLKVLFENYDNLNHSFFPTSGGLTLDKVRIIEIESVNFLLINEMYLLIPESLVFEFMEDFEWSYFRLNIKEVFPVFGTSVYKGKETLFLTENDEVLEFENLDSDEDNEIKTRQVSLYLRGSLLIVQNASKINNLRGDLDHYFGIHNKMSNDDYKKQIEEIRVIQRIRENEH